MPYLSNLGACRVADHARFAIEDLDPGLDSRIVVLALETFVAQIKIYNNCRDRCMLTDKKEKDLKSRECIHAIRITTGCGFSNVCVLLVAKSVRRCLFLSSEQ